MSVIILKDYNDKLNDAFDKIFQRFNFSPKGEVFIKPNFSGRPPVRPGENTDPDILRKLIENIISKGARKVIVGHGALLGTSDKKFPFEEIIKDGGFSFLYKMPKVELLDFDKEEKELIESEGFSFLIPKKIKKFDSYINFAKLKTHMETTVTFSLKNQMGLVSVADRIQMHRNALEESISYIAKLIRPTISIIDGTVSMECNGPHHGKGKNTNLIIAGNDMVELDSAASFLINVDFRKVSHISNAERLGVGRYPSGEYLDYIKKYKIDDFVLAKKYEKFGKNIYAWPTTACSRCITAINESGKIIKRHPLRNIGPIKKIFLGNKKINVVIGRADSLEISKNEKIIAIGCCSKSFAERQNINNLNKCPPSVKETLKYIKKELNY